MVSTKIKVVEISAIGNAVYYYDEQSPKAIADAIMKINIYDSYDSIELIKKLDKGFTDNMKKLLE